MSSPIADGVMAATYKLVQQAMTGQWQDVPKTIEERRVLLEQLSAGATPQDQQWLGALKQAMAESDAAVARMSEADGHREPGFGSREAAPSLTFPRGAGEGTGVAAGSSSNVDGLIDMIRGSR